MIGNLSNTVIRSQSNHHSYYVKDVISSGRFGTVYKAVNTVTQTHHAIKSLLHERNDVPSHLNVQMISREVSNWTKLHKKNKVKDKDKDKDTNYILALNDVIIVPNNQTLLISELCERTLTELSYPLELTFAIEIAYQLLIAVNNCHNNHIIHCDIKPDNIFLTNDNNVRLADFGSSVDTNGENVIPRNLLTHCTPDYAAPEVIPKNFYSSTQDISKQIDIWSYGIVIFDLMLNPLLSSKWKVTEKERHQFMDLIDKCLEKDPKYRITSEVALDHKIWKSYHLP